ncbi:uncharacterized protein LOC116234879 [Phasianus colchicus]|uniref:uncharacterized protein LOC116234879 n=1 Tax=Phasianus colchicus TaxID=9054 RepID=UPI00129D4CCA|nr:uncharacterized protein LOC116234879 [Phasianus colchicus]
MEMPKEEEPKAHSQPNKGLPSVQEQDEVIHRPPHTMTAGSQSPESTLQEDRLPPLPSPHGSHQGQTNKLEDNETLPGNGVLQEDTASVPTLPPPPEQAVAQAAAPEHVPTAEIPTSASGTCELPDLPAAAASVSSGRRREKVFVPEAPGHQELCTTALDSLGKQDEAAGSGKQKSAPPSPAISDAAVENTVQSPLPQVQTETVAVCIGQQDLTQAQQAAGAAKADEAQEATNRVTPQSGPGPQVHTAAMAAHKEAVPTSSGRGYKTPEHQEGTWAERHSAVLKPCIRCQVIGARLWVHHETRRPCRKIVSEQTELLTEMGKSCAACTGQSLASFWELTRQIKKPKKQQAEQKVPCEPQDMAEKDELGEGDDEEPVIINHWVNPRIKAFCRDLQDSPQQTPSSSSITDTDVSGESDGQAQSTALPAASSHTDAKAGGDAHDGHGMPASMSTVEEENAPTSSLQSKQRTAARDESQGPCLHDPTACAISLEDTAQAMTNKLEDNETLSGNGVLQEDTASVPTLPPPPEQAVAQAAAPEHVPTAETPTSASGTCELPDLPAAASASSSVRGREKVFVPEAPGQQESLPSAGRSHSEHRPRRNLLRRALEHLFRVCCCCCSITRQEE